MEVNENQWLPGRLRKITFEIISYNLLCTKHVRHKYVAIMLQEM